MENIVQQFAHMHPGCSHVKPSQPSKQTDSPSVRQPKRPTTNQITQAKYFIHLIHLVWGQTDGAKQKKKQKRFSKIFWFVFVSFDFLLLISCNAGENSKAFKFACVQHEACNFVSFFFSLFLAAFHTSAVLFFGRYFH